jgi:hypothetical protein
MDKIKEQHKRLSWAREAAGFDSAAAAASALGVKTPTYSSHENGWRGFGLAAAKRYAKKFNVNLEWLLTGDGSPRGGNAESKITSTVEASSAYDGIVNLGGPMARNQITKLFDKLTPERQLQIVLQLLKEVEELEEARNPTDQRA